VTNARGFVSQEEQFERIIASDDIANYKIVEAGQFAYNPSRVNVGSIDLLRNFENGILSPMYVVFDVASDQLVPEFLYYQVKSEWFLGHIPMYVQGSVRDSLSFEGLCSIRLFIPSVAEQLAIVEVLRTVDHELALLSDILEALERQHRGLMQQLLTGRVRVNSK
jgi:type I restriction enzyme S subunit